MTMTVDVSTIERRMRSYLLSDCGMRIHSVDIISESIMRIIKDSQIKKDNISKMSERESEIVNVTKSVLLMDNGKISKNENINPKKHSLLTEEKINPVSFQEAMNSGKNIRFEFKNESLEVLETEFKPLDKILATMNANMKSEEIALIINQGNWFVDF